MEKAEVLADHYTTLLNDRIATKEDVSLLRKDMDRLRQDLEGKMVSLEERLEVKMETIGKDLWIKMLISQFGIGGLIIATLSYFG